MNVTILNNKGSFQLATEYGPSEEVSVQELALGMTTENLLALKVQVDLELAKRMLPGDGNRPGREL